MTRYRHGKGASSNNQKRRKGQAGTARKPGKNMGMRARIKHERSTG